MAEISSWVQPTAYQQNLDWLEQAVVSGVEPELARWGEVQQDLYLSATSPILGANRHPGWINSCELAGFYWPLFPDGDQDWISTDPTQLVHQLGFHWYHQDQNAGASDEDPVEGYQGEQQLQEDALQMHTLASELNRDRGYSLSYSVSEVGFHAENNPEGGVGVSGRQPFNEQASPMFQAGSCCGACWCCGRWMMVRR